MIYIVVFGVEIRNLEMFILNTINELLLRMLKSAPPGKLPSNTAFSIKKLRRCIPFECSTVCGEVETVFPFTVRYMIDKTEDELLAHSIVI